MFILFLTLAMIFYDGLLTDIEGTHLDFIQIKHFSIIPITTNERLKEHVTLILAFSPSPFEYDVNERKKDR